MFSSYLVSCRLIQAVSNMTAPTPPSPEIQKLGTGAVALPGVQHPTPQSPPCSHVEAVKYRAHLLRG